jgi:hypothetical protein
MQKICLWFLHRWMKEIIVNYTLNVMGDVDRIWILTRSEIGKQLPVEQVFKPVPYKNTEIK